MGSRLGVKGRQWTLNLPIQLIVFQYPTCFFLHFFELNDCILRIFLSPFGSGLADST